jgi:cell division protein FtsB
VLAFSFDSVYKSIEALFEQLRKTATRGMGAWILLAVGVVYVWIAVSGPQGLQTLLEKHREIRELQEQNAALTREIEHRRDRIRRLEGSRSEQEMEIRKQLKLLRPGETTFILPEAPKEPDPTPAAKEPQ